MTTATLRRSLFVCLTFSLAAAAAETPTLATKTEFVAACVTDREKNFECKEPFIDAMISLRSKYQPEIKDAMSKDPAGTRAQGIKEITEEGSGPLAPRQAKCGEVYEQAKATGRVPPSGPSPLEKCWAITDCSARQKCSMPIYEQLMFKRK